MKKIALIIAAIIICPTIAWSVKNVDVDNNGYVDIAFGGTNSATAAAARTALDVYSKAETDAADDTGTDDQTAAEVSVADAGGYFTGNTVEAILAEMYPQIGGFNESGNYTFTGTFDSSGGTVILPPLTLDPYDSGWAGSQLFASQGDVYAKIESLGVGGGATEIADLTDWPTGLTATELNYVNGATSNIQSQINNLIVGSGGVVITTDTPTAAGQIYLDDTNDILSVGGTTGYYTVVLSSFTTYPAAPTPPSAPTMVISGAGPQVATFTYGEAITADTTADLCDWDITMSSAGTLTLGYSSGDGTTSVVCSISESVYDGDSVALASYTQGTIQASDDNTLMANITDFSGSITNSSSEQSGGECDGFIICQNFEGTGVDNDETSLWTFTNADEDYASTNVIRGSQSVELDESAGSNNASVTISSTPTEAWIHMIWKESSVSGAMVDLVRFYTSSGGTEIATLMYAGGSTDQFRLYVGSTFSSGSADLADGTDYHFWFHFNFVTHEGEFYYGTDATRPETATCDEVGDNTLTTLGYIQIPGRTYTASNVYIDQVLVRTSEFTTVAE